MLTNMLYQVERPKSQWEQRELNRVNGEIAMAISRAFRWFKASRPKARALTGQWPGNDGQPRLRVGAFPCEQTVPQASCN